MQAFSLIQQIAVWRSAGTLLILRVLLPSGSTIAEERRMTTQSQQLYGRLCSPVMIGSPGSR